MEGRRWIGNVHLHDKCSVTAMLVDLETGKGEKSIAAACDYTVREKMKK